MRNENERIHPEEELDREGQNAELTLKELDSVAGGRITNVRANANGISGGGPIPANVVA